MRSKICASQQKMTLNFHTLKRIEILNPFLTASIYSFVHRYIPLDAHQTDYNFLNAETFNVHFSITRNNPNSGQSE